MSLLYAENKSAKTKKHSAKDLNWKWLFIPAAALLAAVLLNSFCIVCAIVPSASMEDTVKAGSLVVASRLSYYKKSPARGDVILFCHEELGTSFIMKRIVGLPGETVEIYSGQVYIDGTSLSESYVKGKTSDFGPVVVPEDHYFVLGDNREHSYDARFWEDPFVSFDEIRARAAIVLFPSLKEIE